MALELLIRRADDRASEDRAFIEDLGKRTVHSSMAQVREAPEAFLEAGYDRLLSIVFEQSHVALIAERSDVRVGFLVMVDSLPDEVTLSQQGFIAYMAVEPAEQHAGIGAELLKAAEDEARKRGLPYMSLMVTDENIAARALYDRAGYVTERRLLCKPL
jgi:ribosomal protein S18 acetylase RimI-like enzyme